MSAAFGSRVSFGREREKPVTRTHACREPRETWRRHGNPYSTFRVSLEIINDGSLYPPSSCRPRRRRQHFRNRVVDWRRRLGTANSLWLFWRRWKLGNLPSDPASSIPGSIIDARARGRATFYSTELNKLVEFVYSRIGLYREPGKAHRDWRNKAPCRILLAKSSFQVKKLTWFFARISFNGFFLIFL